MKATSVPIHLIERQAELNICLDVLYGHSELALDLEFDSHSYAYGVTLALIQIATPIECYLIDPFAPLDLNGLYDLLEDDRIAKIMHSPGEDLRLLHSLDCLPRNVFDTEIAARLLNYEHTSLAIMLEAKLGYLMSKKQQRSNWLIRPLTQEQISYAAADVTSLHALKVLLVAEADERGLGPFIRDEQRALSETTYQQEAKKFFLKPADTYSMSPYEQYVLNSLLVYRDDLARSLNRPAYKVIDESIMRALAKGTMQPDELATAKGVHPQAKSDPSINRLSASLARIIADAKEDNLSNDLPARKRLSSEEWEEKNRLDKDKAQKFVPIQAALSGRYGTFAARYILSNGQIADLLDKKQRPQALQQGYRRQVIFEIAAELGIDVSMYL